jgi:hypothetical protein
LGKALNVLNVNEESDEVQINGAITGQCSCDKLHCPGARLVYDVAGGYFNSFT